MRACAPACVHVLARARAGVCVCVLCHVCVCLHIVSAHVFGKCKRYTLVKDLMVLVENPETQVCVEPKSMFPSLLPLFTSIVVGMLFYAYIACHQNSRRQFCRDTWHFDVVAVRTRVTKSKSKGRRPLPIFVLHGAGGSEETKLRVGVQSRLALQYSPPSWHGT